MAHHGPLVKRPKTPPFHGGNTGSNPVRVTNFVVRGSIFVVRTSNIEYRISNIEYRFAPVAQSVEQRTENPRVGGSIPSWGTTLGITIKFERYSFGK